MQPAQIPISQLQKSIQIVKALEDTEFFINETGKKKMALITLSEIIGTLEKSIETVSVSCKTWESNIPTWFEFADAVLKGPTGKEPL